MKSDKFILLTIDVEDWFQVENFKPWIPFSTWDQRELRVEKNTHRLLDLFDSIELKAPQLNRFRIQRGRQSSKLTGKGTEDINKKTENNTQQTSSPHTSHHQAIDYELSAASYEESFPKVTFFILEWIAKKLPDLVREIHSRGHEIASHGCNHHLPDKLSADELEQDLTESKKMLEDITGAEVVGYRAPSFAVNDNVLKTIENTGYLYDSSYNSFGMHGRYGKISLNGSIRKGIAHKLSESFFELPISNLQLGRRTIPLGGGGYFRLLPTPIFSMGIKAALKRQEAFVFYAHPWEFDPTQPRVENASASFKFRHYVNLKGAQSKLVKLIRSFSDCRFLTCKQYLSKTN